MIPLSVPSLKGNELKYVAECIETEWVSSVGSYVTRFEAEIARFTGSPHTVACMNGTSALHISLLLAGVAASDEVIVPTLTFIAPVNAVRYVGAHPVFMDCDDHLNIDPEKLETFLTQECLLTSKGLINKVSKRKISALVAVHVFGQPCNLKPIVELMHRYQLALIEDATESLGSFYTNWEGKSGHTGTIGTLGCLSFNGNKLITTGGGGMILTADKELAYKARYLTTQAKDDAKRFIHNKIGYNYRLTNVQAAIGCAQLEQINRFLETKKRNFEIYREALQGVEGLRLIDEPEGTISNRWHYTLVVDEQRFGMNAAALVVKLAKNEIESRPIWELNHRQRPYQGCQAYWIDKAIFYHERCLNLPCSVGLKPEEVQEVCRFIRGFS